MTTYRSIHENDFIVTRKGRDPKPTGGSWWQGIDRAAFSREIALRFAVNRAEPNERGYNHTARLDKARRGGQRKAINSGEFRKTA